MDIPQPDQVPDWLAREIKVRGITIMELAERAGLGRNQVSRIKRGTSGTRVSTLAKLAEALATFDRAA